MKIILLIITIICIFVIPLTIMFNNLFENEMRSITRTSRLKHLHLPNKKLNIPLILISILFGILIGIGLIIISMISGI